MASFIETVLRSPDLLHIQFEFVNLTLGTAADGTPQLKRVAGQTACIVIRLPPQHIAEQVFNSADQRTFPYQALLASPSRLAFDIPESIELPTYTVVGILDKIRELSLRPPDQTLGTGPATAIELPYRVLLVPAPNTRLFHRGTSCASVPMLPLWQAWPQRIVHLPLTKNGDTRDVRLSRRAVRLPSGQAKNATSAPALVALAKTSCVALK
jgi:hypothetical protein